MKKVLLVIDMQNDFINGSLGSKEAVAIVPKVVEKVKQAQKNKVKITFYHLTLLFYLLFNYLKITII